MAVGRTPQRRLWKPGLPHRTDASKRIGWRAVVLIFAAVAAAAFATYSLIVDPPDTAPADISYLPDQ